MNPPALDRYLDQFGHELARAGRRRAGTPWPASPRALALALALLAALVATALAATGVLSSGSPVKDPYGDAVHPDQGIGIPVPTSAHLTSLRVADPGGGLAWGLRVLKTTRRAGCVQVGRVLDGKLGVLGRDGAFHDDGLFHVLGPEDASRSDCQPLDGAGKLYIAMSVQGLPASAWPFGCTTSAAYTPPRSAHLPHVRRPAPCPVRDERILYYGTLGPQARSVTYRDARGALHSEATVGAEGAYLVVTRSSRRHPARGSFSPGVSPASGLVSVTYRNGRRCVIPNPTRLGGAVACPPVGYVEPRVPLLGPGRPSRTVTARFSRHPIHPLLGPPPGTPAPEADWRLTVSFHAPVSTPTTTSYYVVTKGSTRGPEAQCRSTVAAPIAHAVRRGQVATATFYVSPRCHGQIHGTVYFHHSGRGRRADQMPFAGIPEPNDPPVGRYAVRIPRRAS